jgi:hypothetical protein
MKVRRLGARAQHVGESDGTRAQHECESEWNYRAQHEDESDRS